MSKSEPGKKDLVTHLGLAGVASITVILFVFYIYLPTITNHGESITVPDLKGTLLDDLDESLEERGLRYRVEPDSGYSPEYLHLAVLKQFPLAETKVKEGRKIYITLNASKPPIVKMPSLIHLSLTDAEFKLENLGLSLGDITYMPDSTKNVIFGQYYHGDTLEPGYEISKGSKVDFEVGAGLGRPFQMMTLTGMPLDEAVSVVCGSELKIGNVFYEKKVSPLKKKQERKYLSNPLVPGRE